MQNLDPIESQAARKMAISAIVLGALAWVIAALCWGGCATSAGDPATSGVPNLDKVEQGIWRGGQPRSAEAWAYLRGLGLTNDIKLNTVEEASDREAVSAGFRLFYFPIDTMDQLIEGPDQAAMSNALAMVVPGTFIHCEHGRDRTGLLVGLYRLQEGTNAAAAWCEMTNHGYHPALLGLTRFWGKQTLK